jgi:hypothetical protein
MGKYSEEELYDMDDTQLSAALAEERAEMESPDTEYEEDVQEVLDETEYDEVEVEQPDEGSADSDEEHDSEMLDEEEVPADEADNTETDEDVVAQPNAEEQSEAAPKKYTYKANGQEFEFTQDEIVSQFGKVFGQAMNYTKKMQAISPYRKMISALEEEQLTEDDMNLMIDALKGNKDAIASMVKRANVDVLDLDLDEESDYVPNSYGRNESELRVKEVIDEISHDKEFPITQNIVAEQWDEQSREVFAQSPELIKELHIDVANGTFDKVSPMAMKMKVLDGARRSDLDYYIEAGKQYHMSARAAELQAQEQEKVQQVEVKQQQRAKVREAAPKRKAATIPRKRVSTPKVTDYLEDSDEAFEEWYAKLQDSM